MTARLIDERRDLRSQRFGRGGEQCIAHRRIIFERRECLRRSNGKMLWEAFAPHAKAEGAAVEAMKTPAVRERLEGLGAVIVSEDRATPEYLGQFVKSEIEKWAAPIKASGVTVD